MIELGSLRYRCSGIQKNSFGEDPPLSSIARPLPVALLVGGGMSRLVLQEEVFLTLSYLPGLRGMTILFSRYFLDFRSSWDKGIRLYEGDPCALYHASCCGAQAMTACPVHN